MSNYFYTSTIPAEREHLEYRIDECGFETVERSTIYSLGGWECFPTDTNGVWLAYDHPEVRAVAAEVVA